MTGNESKYERIIRYLKGLLSNRERYDLEKEMMQDAFEEEAFEGLNQLSADELETDMELLRSRLNDRIAPERKRSLGIFYRIAAGIILLAGIAGILYLVFRIPSQSLITEETGKETLKVPPAFATPPMPDTVFPSKAQTEEKSRPVKSPRVLADKTVQQEKKSVAVETVNALAETAMETMAETRAAQAVSEEQPAEREQVSDELHEPADSRSKAAAAAPVAKERAGAVYKRAKVVDMDGNPLPGVTVLEKGSARGTVTDIDGMFTLEAFDSGSVLSLSYIGFVPVEMNAKDMAGKEISMTEDLVALEEVVVVGYGAQKKSDVTGAEVKLQMEDISPQGNAEVSVFVNPVPPGGSLKAFKQWVTERLDDSIVNAFPERQKIMVNITVQADGSIGEIRIKDTVPEPLVKEFRRVISQSPRWNPAMKDDTPVVSKVEVRFVTGAE